MTTVGEQTTHIPDLSARLRRIVGVLADAARSEFHGRLDTDDHDDELVDVEVAINMMIGELDLARRQNEAQRHEIEQQSAALVERQRQLVRALSTPLIAVWPGVLTLPLIGPIDRERSATITDALLSRVAAEGTAYVILDVTGVGEPDLDMAHTLVKTAQALALLGARCLVTGVTQAMARAMIDSGQELAAIPTMHRLSDALAWIIRRRNEAVPRGAMLR